MATNIWFWIGFNILILGMLALDLGLLGRKEHVIHFREALVRIEERDLEEQADLPVARRARLVTRRLARTLALAWLGIVPWNRSHPPIEDRITRIAAELGAGAAAEQCHRVEDVR